jgi:glycine hydroxymethyltransferase
MSATAANEIVMFSVLAPGEVLLGLELDSGGHLTHGSKASISGQVFRSIGYGLTRDERIDYEQAQRLAREHRPKLIVCGTTAYSRQIDWERFRAIADEVGAYVLADITHIAGLVAAGCIPRPWTTRTSRRRARTSSSTAARGGVILMGKDADAVAPDGKRTLAETIQKRVFPFFQGAPNRARSPPRRAASRTSPRPSSSASPTLSSSRARSAEAVREKACASERGGDGQQIVRGGG